MGESSSRKVPPLETLVELNQTLNVMEIADKYEVTPDAIRWHFRRAGISPIRHSEIERQLPPADKLAKMNREMTLEALAEKLGVCSKWYLSKYLRKHGYRPVRHGRRKYNLNEIVKMIKAGHTVNEIAQKLGSTRGAIFTKIYRAGLTVRELRQ